MGFWCTRAHRLAEKQKKKEEGIAHLNVDASRREKGVKARKM
jgi:hypothetical protein